MQYHGHFLEKKHFNEPLTSTAYNLQRTIQVSMRPITVAVAEGQTLSTLIKKEAERKKGETLYTLIRKKHLSSRKSFSIKQTCTYVTGSPRTQSHTLHVLNISQDTHADQRALSCLTLNSQSPLDESVNYWMLSSPDRKTERTRPLNLILWQPGCCT